MQIPNEEWKAVDKKFLISSLGRIFNLETKEFHRPSIHKSRSSYYLRISLDGKAYMLHVLVALNFHSPTTPEHTQVDHKDNNTLNPAAYNLNWVTPGHNITKAHNARCIKYGETYYRGKVRKLIIKKRVHK